MKYPLVVSENTSSILGQANPFLRIDVGPGVTATIRFNVRSQRRRGGRIFISGSMYSFTACRDSGGYQGITKDWVSPVRISWNGEKGKAEIPNDPFPAWTLSNLPYTCENKCSHPARISA